MTNTPDEFEKFTEGKTYYESSVVPDDWLEGEDVEDGEDYYTSTEVAKIFAVSDRTVARYHKEGKFAKNGVSVIETFGGHRRFKKEEIHDLFDKMIKGELED